ncbi:hypothetical protein BFF94_029005 [Burkholderia catarinensis]|nr:hypothetical protein BFF94_029005 [Burkholderia catarinensis]
MVAIQHPQILLSFTGFTATAERLCRSNASVQLPNLSRLARMLIRWTKAMSSLSRMHFLDALVDEASGHLMVIAARV